MNNLNIEPRTIFCRDNLDILTGINSDCIDLIYLDPPFNTKKVFTAPIGSSAEGAEFSDIFREEDIKDEWVKSIEFESPDLYSYLIGVRTFSNMYSYCYLVYMAIRLIECKRIMKDTASIYLHCDPTMSHYLKIVMDCIFGEGNFKNEITWCYRGMPAKIKRFASKHDCILYYVKSNKNTFNIQYDSPTEGSMRTFESGMRKGYNVNLSKKMVTVFDWDKYNQAVKDGKLPNDLNPKEFTDGQAPMKDWWDDIKILGGPYNKERTGYPTQKPLALLERIIKASSNEGDVVLDPFCGCATTCIAAERLQRKWIGIDVSIKAYELVKQRLQKEVPVNLFRGEPHYSHTPPMLSGMQVEKTGDVYIISNIAFKGMYKVGISKNAKNRLNNYQTSDPNRGYKLEYYLTVPYFMELEKHIHKKFKNNHEWVYGELADIKKEMNDFKPPI